MMTINSCGASEYFDYVDETSPYSDVECSYETDFYDRVSNTTFYTMMISDTFNPYKYYNTGEVQTSTRFDGRYTIGPEGNYLNAVTLESNAILYSAYYANINKVKYNDGFFFGLNQTESDFYDY